MRLKEEEVRKEAQRWLKEAEADLKAAKDSLKDKNYNWSCFQSQQSAEKALKAYLYNLGYSSLLTHSVKVLLNNCLKKEKKFKKLLEPARSLDMYYISTRYPNGIDPQTIPSEYFDAEDAQKCLSYAILILKTVKESLKK
ncbi:MAG: HEPN domain-containing protein [Candidatus Omnitrophica bacterium]|nr:HEPN domain-containing protein [Candidatus Omnitrophota bacterium]